MAWAAPGRGLCPGPDPGEVGVTTAEFADAVQALLLTVSGVTVAVAVSMTVFRLIRKAANTI